MKRKRKKYGVGTKVTDYLEDPKTELMQNDINIAKGMYESQSNPFLMGLDLASQMGMQFASKMAMGGPVKKIPVEIEGEEVVETPDGQVLEAEGPSHEQGGIDIDLPKGTDVYSKRISIDGKTMAKRKLEREKRLSKVLKQLEENPTDQVLKNSKKRIEAINQKEEAQDNRIQEAAAAQVTQNAPREKFALGGDVDFNEGFSPNFSLGGNGGNTLDLSSFLSNLPQGLPSASEALGLAGTLYSGVSPYLNTLKNKASDTPNENMYKDFGLEALKSIDQQKKYVQSQEDSKLQDLELSRNSALKRNRQVQSLSTANALNLATDQGINDAKAKAFDMSSQQMMNILAQEAQANNLRDDKVMTGEYQKDIANRQDKDNFFTQLSENQVGLGRSVQEASKNLGQIALNDSIISTINSYSNNFSVDRNGNITDKSGTPLNSAQKNQLKKDATAAGYDNEGEFLSDNPNYTFPNVDLNPNFK